MLCAKSLVSLQHQTRPRVVLGGQGLKPAAGSASRLGGFHGGPLTATPAFLFFICKMGRAYLIGLLQGIDAVTHVNQTACAQLAKGPAPSNCTAVLFLISISC